jgi:hypothetical protein
MNVEKKKTKKTNKQKGGLNNNNNFYRIFNDNNSRSPLATIFRFGPIRNNQTVARNTSNQKFIKEIKELLLSQTYQQNVPVFYGNMNSNKSSGYNEYICKIVGVFSSRKRIFIINPFAEFVYRFYIFCMINNISKIIEKLNNLLKKLLKLDNFIGFPEIKYLPYGIRFCIVKDRDGVEKVITSQQPNISRCKLVYGCSLMMSAEIRKENLPSEQNVIEFYNILNSDYNLLELYRKSKNKAEYNKINNERKLLQNNERKKLLQNNERKKLLQNNERKKLLQNKYFEGIIMLLLKLNNLKNQIIQLKEAYNKNINRIKASKNTAVIKKILIQQEEARQSIILSQLKEILNISNSDIPELQKLYNYVKSQLQQQNVNLLELTSRLIQEITNLIKLKPEQLKSFLSFLETNPIQKSTILEIFEIN